MALRVITPVGLFGKEVFRYCYKQEKKLISRFTCRLYSVNSDHIIRCPFLPNTFKIPEVDFGTTLFNSLSRRPANLALTNATTKKDFTRSEVLTRSETLARRLTSHGCRKGDVIAIFAPNSVDWLLVTSAAFRIGAVVAGINNLSTSAELSYQLNACHAKYLYTVKEIVSVALDAVKSTTVEVFLSDNHDGCISLPTEVAGPGEHLPQLPSLQELSIKPQDVALIMFSSGTTGPQKAVLLSHHNLHADILVYRQPKFDMMSDRQPVIAPFCHVAGLSVALAVMADEVSSLIFMEKFDLPVFLGAISENKIKKIAIIPLVATLFAKHPVIDKFKLSLTDIFVGAAPLSREVEDLLIQRFPGVNVRQVYGMTEVLALAAAVPNVDANSSRKRRPGTVGVPLHNVQMKVIDVETGVALGPRTSGEVCVYGPKNMLGYVDNPQATAATIDKDGWLHTGDIGYYDEDGYFYIVDRLKELIKYKGYQVAPAELEAVLLAHPQMLDAGVAGVPDEVAGELPLAWVVKKPDATISEREIQDYVAGKVAPHKALRGGVRFVAAIPKNNSGKILRREIKRIGLTGTI